MDKKVKITASTIAAATAVILTQQASQAAEPTNQATKTTVDSTVNTTVKPAPTNLATSKANYTDTQASLNTAKSNVATAQTDYNTAKTNLNTATTNVADINKQITQTDKAGNQAVADAKTQVTNNLNTATTNLNTAKETANTADKKVTDLTTAKDTVSTQVDDTATKVSTLEQANPIAKTELASAQDQVNKTSADVNTATTNLNKQQGIVDSAQKSLDTATANVDKANQLALSADKALARAMDAQITAKENYDKLLAEYNSLVATDSTGRIAQIQAELKTAKTQLDTANAKLADATTQANTAKKAYDEAVALKQQQDTIVANATKAVTTAQNNLNSAQTTLDSLIAQQTAAKQAEAKALADKTASKAALDKALADQKVLAQKITDTQNALNQAKTDLANAKAQLAVAQKAVDAANNYVRDKFEYSSAGFFKSVGSTNASSLFNNRTTMEYKPNTNSSMQPTNAFDKTKALEEHTNIGDDKDSTSLKNMLKAVEMIQSANKIRAELGLPLFKVTDNMMAMAQLMVNADANLMNHIAYSNDKSIIQDPSFNKNTFTYNIYNVRENIAWGRSTTGVGTKEADPEYQSSPFFAWVTQEQAISFLWEMGYRYDNTKPIGTQWTKDNKVNDTRDNNNDGYIGINPKTGLTLDQVFERANSAFYIQTGHYNTFIDPEYILTGIGHNEYSSLYETTTNQIFNNGNRGQDPTKDPGHVAYTPEEYKHRLLNYQNALLAKEAKAKADAQAMLNSAQSALNATTKKVTDIANQLKALTSIDSTIANLTNDLNAKTDISNKATATRQALDTKVTAQTSVLQSLKDKLAAAKSELAKQQLKQTSLANDVNTKKATYDSALQVQANAQKAVDSAKTTVQTISDKLANIDAYLAKVTADKDDAKTILDKATQKVEDTKTKRDVAYDDVKAKLDQKNAIVAALVKAKEDLAQAAIALRIAETSKTDALNNQTNIKAKYKELSDAQDLLASLREQLAQLEKDLELAQKEAVDANARLNKAQEEYKEAKGRYERGYTLSWNGENTNIEDPEFAYINKYAERIKELKAMLVGAQEVLENAKKEFEIASENLANANKAFAEALVNNTNAKNTYEKFLKPQKAYAAERDSKTSKSNAKELAKTGDGINDSTLANGGIALGGLLTMLGIKTRRREEI